MKRLFLFLFAAILGITQVWGATNINVIQNGTGSTTKTFTVPSGFVDLGLSVLWYEKNLGASSKADNGDLYEWGGTSKKTTNASSSNYTVYPTGMTNSNNILPVAKDAAYQTDSTCRIPTLAEWNELISACTAKNDATLTINGTSFTLPCTTGIINSTSNANRQSTTNGYYWSSTWAEGSGNSIKANICKVTSSNYTFAVSTNKDYGRNGLAIRPVYNKKIYKLTLTIGTATYYVRCFSGDQVTVNVTEASGSTFTGSWTKTAGTDLTRSDNTFTVTADATYKAGFDEQEDPPVDPEYVDLGLPSGTLWADRNLGATSALTGGGFYAFGETSTKDDYSKSTYSLDLSKNVLFETVDGEQMLKDAYDPAMSIGTGWRTPNHAEINELFANCTISQISEGYRLTSNVNSNHIDIPSLGYKSGSSIQSSSDAWLWTRTVHTQSFNADNAYAYAGNLYVLSIAKSIMQKSNPHRGCQIRPIYVPSGTTVTATFVMDDNSAYTTNQVDKYTEPSVTAPTKSSTETYDYTFNTWIPALSKISVPTTYKASFTATPIDFTITYDLQDGSVASANPEKYNVESNAITLNNPTKPGYDFAGWTGTGLDGAQMTVVISKGSKGARSYKATWTEVTALTLVDDKNAGDSWYTWLGGCVGEDKFLDVTYQRTFPAGTTAEPSWSVFSLPFNYYIEDAGATFADKVLNMDHATYDGEILSIYCTYETLKIEANRPYILYNTGAEIVNPVFAGVTVKALAENSYDKPCSGGGTVTFKNTTCYQQLPENNKNILFIGNNQLYYPGDATYLRAFRGYFVLDGVRPDSAPKRVRLMVNETTGLESNMQNEQQSATEKVVENGALYIIRNGVRYDARGAEIR